MIDQLRKYIAACEENIEKYKAAETVDEKAIAATEKMIAEFAALIQKYAEE